MKKNLFTILFAMLACAVAAQPADPIFKIQQPGERIFVDYEKYGKFEGIGTSSYKYTIADAAGLSKAVGTGIHPYSDYSNDSLYKAIKSQGRLAFGGHWDYVGHFDKPAAFYKWATAADDPGVKLFFTAEILKESGNVEQALKAYYAILVHFPGSAAFGGGGSWVWYIAPVAIDKIIGISRKHPELGFELKDASVTIQNGGDNDLKNDIVTVNPGKLVKRDLKQQKPDLTTMKVIAERGKGKVQLKKYENGHWQVFVHGKPYTVKAVTYGATKVGEAPQNGTMRNWMFVDDNLNGKIDGPEEAFLDLNANNKKDADEKGDGDFAILKEMGCNVIRLYHSGSDPELIYNKKKAVNKELLRKMYNDHGIMAMMGDFLGAYTIGMGGLNAAYTDYTNPVHRERLKAIVREYVMDNKDEPYVLMWLLGNENNMPANIGGVNATATNASKYPKEYAEFLNEVAKMIHEIDPDHPVAIGNQEVTLAEYYNQYAPDIDIIGCNLYRGKDGFGSAFDFIQKNFDRPVIVTEYGYEAYNYQKHKEDQDYQVEYHKGNWEDIMMNAPGNVGAGNCVGGVAFQYLDEWWKDGNQQEFFQHGTSPDGEWYGILGQGDGKLSPYLREVRKVFYYYKAVWNNQK